MYEVYDKSNSSESDGGNYWLGYVHTGVLLDQHSLFKNQDRSMNLKLTPPLPNEMLTLNKTIIQGWDFFCLGFYTLLFNKPLRANKVVPA